MDDNTRNDKTLGEFGAEDSLKGKATHAKGHIKDAVGGLTGDKSLQAEGKIDQVKGKAKDAIGNIQRDAGRDRDAR